MTTPEDVPERLRALSAEQLHVGAAELVPDALLGDDLGVDSLAAIEWGMAVEDAFGITLPDDAWGYVRSYGMVEDLVRRLVRRAGAPQAPPQPRAGAQAATPAAQG